MSRPKEGAFKNYTLIKNFSTYAFLYTEIYYKAFPLAKSRNFYCNVYSVRLLASALAYLSSDLYHSASPNLATVSECRLQLNVLGG